MIKKTPDIEIDYISNLYKFKKKLSNKTGIYCYFYRTICIYVGATKKMYPRAFRHLLEKENQMSFAGALLQCLGSYQLTLKIYFYKLEELNKREKEYISILNPISQKIGSCGYPRRYMINIKK